MKKLSFFVITKFNGKEIKEGKFKPFRISKLAYMKIKTNLRGLIRISKKNATP